MSSGAGEDKLLLSNEPGLNKIPNDFSPDGRFLLYARTTGDGLRDLWVLPLKEDGAPAGLSTPFLATPFDEAHSRFSPDGHWVAYVSDESGRSEVYVRSFPAPAVGASS